ncbi:MAG: DUF1549 domain-containing protein, partial [Planctomycetota bacterium]|nr:DUF1549 domain-containing protein [Planctomycetota bacterium]
LDLARYADSNGYANDGLRSVWPYRDWVITAINEDMPFDQFTIEQLAGDLLPEATQSQKIATGFHRNTPHQTEGGSDPEQYRVERTKNRTDTTGAVWLGLTVGCAQCHSHKFDPISHNEYYSLYAFFNNSEEPTLTLAPTGKAKQQLETTADEIKALESEILATTKRQPTPKNIVWQETKFSAIKSLHGATLKQLEDLTVLATGKNPHQDTYRLQFETLKPFQSIRIEALTDPSLPKNGPGRATNGNFVLAELKIQSNGKPEKITAGIADHSQQNYHVTAAFDGNPKTGWAINLPGGSLNQNRTARFSLEKPLQGRIRMTLTTYEQGSGYNLGKFKVSISDQVPPELDARLVKLKNLLKSKQAILKNLQKGTATTLIIRERPQPRQTFVQLRGDFLDPGQKVLPATFSTLHPLQNPTPDDLHAATREKNR